MELAAIVLLVLAERARPDLYVRRWWAGLHLPRPGLPVRVPVPIALAGFDARRLALRVTMLGLLYVVLRLPWTFNVKAYEGVNNLIGFYLCFAGLAVLALVAMVGGRDRGQELLEALPGSGRSRVGGWAVLLVGAALVEYALLLGLRYVPESPSYASLLPNAWELAQGPLLLLGGGLLGLLGARLLPSWIATPVCVVLGVAWVGVFSANATSITMLAPVVEWIQYREDDLVLVEPGSFAWHNAYLLGLCGLGLVAALLREQGRRAGLIVTGTVVALGTITAAALALP